MDARRDFHWFLLFLSYAGLFSLGFIETSRGPIYPEILAEWGLKKNIGALFFSLASVAALVVNLTASRWLPLLGSLNGLRLFLFCLALGTFGMGWAAQAWGHFQGVLALALVFGMGLGGLGVVFNVLVIEATPSRWQRNTLSGLHAMYGLASLLAPQFVAWVAHYGWDWKTLLQWVALVPAAVLLTSLGTQRDEARTEGAESEASPVRGFRGDRVKRWYVASIMGFYVGAEMALSSRMVLVLRSEFDFSVEQASNFLSLFFVGLMGGRLVTTFVRLPWSNRTVLLASALLSILSMSLGLYVHTWFLPLTGLTMSVFFPFMVALASEVDAPHADEIVAAGMSAVGVSLISVHWGLGTIAEWTSVRASLLLGPVFLLMAMGLCWGLTRFLPRR